MSECSRNRFTSVFTVKRPLEALWVYRASVLYTKQRQMHTPRLVRAD